MNSKTLSPAEVVTAFYDGVWRRGVDDELRQCLAEPCWRHDTDFDWATGSGRLAPLVEFSVDEHLEHLAYAVKITGDDIEFDCAKLLESGDYVTAIWDRACKPAADIRPLMESQGCLFEDDGTYRNKGIEVFHVVDGKIAEIWVAHGPWQQGVWGETKTDEGAPDVPDQAAMSRTDIIRNYVTRMWNEADATAIDDYLAETCWRHDAGEPDRQFMKFDHAFQKQRAQEGYNFGTFDFRFIKLLESGEYVTMVWDLSLTPASDELRKVFVDSGSITDEKGDIVNNGMEVFRIRNGKVIEVWIAQDRAYQGSWGESMT